MVCVSKNFLGSLPGLVVVCASVTISACGVLPGKSSLPPTIEYSLNAGFAPGPVGAAGAGKVESCVDAQVMLPRAAAGYNTPRMAYTLNQDSLNYYAYSRWVDTPAYMLQPLLVEALQRSGRFRTVVKSPSPVRTRFRLLTDDLVVVQRVEGKSNLVRIGLRLQLLDMQEGILTIDESIVIEKPTAANPKAGVAMANSIASELLVSIADRVRNAVDIEVLCTP